MSIRLVSTGRNESFHSGDQLERAIMELKDLLRDLFRMRHEGAAYAKLSHAQGVVDGYMKMMGDIGLLSDNELLAIVADVRRGSDGPATCQVETPTVFEVTRAIA